jgi:hypothetical protein
VFGIGVPEFRPSLVRQFGGGRSLGFTFRVGLLDRALDSRTLLWVCGLRAVGVPLDSRRRQLRKVSEPAVGHAVEVQEVVSVLARVAGRLVAHDGTAARVMDGLGAAQAVLGHLCLERGDIIVGAHALTQR